MPLNALPRYIDDVGMIVSSTDLEIMRANIALCDALSFRSMPAFDNSADSGGLNGPGHYHDSFWYWGATEQLWWGSLQFMTGMTTMSLVNVNAGVLGTETITVYLNGVSRLAYTPTNGTTTKTITISGLGFADADIIQIQIYLSGTRNTSGEYKFWDITAGPVTYPTSYPGVPSFSGTYNATKLNQLVDAYTWLYNRMAITPIIPMLAHIGAESGFAVGSYEIYCGAVLRAFSQDALRIHIGTVNAAALDWKLVVNLNGVSAYDSGSRGIGYYDDDLTISLASVTVGSRADVQIFYVITNQGSPVQHIRYSLWNVRSDGAYPYSSALSAPPAGYSDMTQAQRDTLLNAYATAITAIKTRLDATLSIWGAARAMRMWYDPVPGRVDAPLAHRYVPRMHQRLGDRALVRGKGLKIGWGPISAPVDTEGPIGYDHWVALHEEGVTDADEMATTTVYLDGYAGLYPGSAYLIEGGAFYVEELI